MARTTAGAVRDTLLDDYDSEHSLSRFILEASLLTDRVAACAARRGRTLSGAELEAIECNLAAHFYVQTAGKFTGRAEQGVVSGQFQGQTGKGLEGSSYGLKALTLDTSGCLAAIGTGAERKTAGAAWLGKRASEQIPYERRD